MRQQILLSVQMRESVAQAQQDLNLDQLQTLLQNRNQDIRTHVRWEVLYAKWEAFTPGLENENK